MNHSYSNNENNGDTRAPVPNPFASSKEPPPVAATSPSSQAPQHNDLAAAAAQYWSILIQASSASHPKNAVTHQRQQMELQSNGSSMLATPSLGSSAVAAASNLPTAMIMPPTLHFGNQTSVPSNQPNNLSTWTGQSVHQPFQQFVQVNQYSSSQQRTTQMQLPTVQNIEAFNQMFRVPIHPEFPQQRPSAGGDPNSSTLAPEPAPASLPPLPAHMFEPPANTVAASRIHFQHPVIQHIMSMMGSAGPASVATTSYRNSISTASDPMGASKQTVDQELSDMAAEEGNMVGYQQRQDNEPPSKRQRNEDNHDLKSGAEVKGNYSPLPRFPVFGNEQPDQSPESQPNIDSEVESDRASSNSISIAADIISVASVHDIKEDHDEDEPEDIKAMSSDNAPNCSTGTSAGEDETEDAFSKKLLALSPVNEVKKVAQDKASFLMNGQRNPTIEVVSYFVSQKDNCYIKAKKPIKNVNRKPLANRPWHDSLHHKMARRNMVATMQV